MSDDTAQTTEPAKARKRAAKKQAATPRGPRATERTPDEQADIESTAIMEPPPAVPLHEALRRVMAEMPSVGKGRDMGRPGDRTHYKYRGIEDLLPHFTRIAAYHGVTMRPSEIVAWNTDTVGTTQAGNPKEQTQLKIRWKIIGPAGDHDMIEIPSQAIDTSDKGVAKAVTQSRKLLIECLIFPPTEDADDPDHHSPQRGDDRGTQAPPVVDEREWDPDRLAFAQSQLDVVTDEVARAKIVATLATAAELTNVVHLSDFPGRLDEWVCNGVEHWVERWLDKQASAEQQPNTSSDEPDS